MIIFCNTDLTDSVSDALKRQLFIAEEIDGHEFDLRVKLDPTYVSTVRLASYKLLVLRDLSDYTNRDMADVVIFLKAGLATVEINKVGPHGRTYPIDKLKITNILS